MGCALASEFVGYFWLRVLQSSADAWYETLSGAFGGFPARVVGGTPELTNQGAVYVLG